MKNIFHPRVEYFIACAKHSSFSEAARQMGLTQAALSIAIKTLEGELGIKLFHRHPGGFSLTLEGKAFLEQIRALYRQSQAALEPIVAGMSRPMIRIGSVPHFSQRYLFPILRQKNALLSQVQLYGVRSYYLYKWVEEGALDFAFVGWSSKPAYHRHIRLYKDPTAIVGHRKKFAHIAKVKKLTDLAHEPWIEMPKAQYDLQKALNPFQHGYVVDNVIDLKYLILNGYAISEVQIQLFTDAELKHLVIALAASPHRDLTMYALYSPTLSEEAKSCFEYVIQETQKRLTDDKTL